MRLLEGIGCLQIQGRYPNGFTRWEAEAVSPRLVGAGASRLFGVGRLVPAYPNQGVPGGVECGGEEEEKDEGRGGEARVQG